MPRKTTPLESDDGEQKKQRRSRSRQPGSIQEYPTDQGKRWRFQIYVLKDPEYPEMGMRRLTRSRFTNTAEQITSVRDNPLSANSVHKIHVVLGAILDAAIEDGHLTLNPTKKKRTVKAPKSSEVRAQKPEIVTWTADQLHTFLTWNRDELKDELFPLWRLIAYTGMRRSEALTLKWNDINTKTMRISIRRAVNTDDGNLRSPDAITDRWSRRLNWVEAP